MASSYPPPGGDDQNNNPPNNQPPGYEPPSQGGYVPPTQGYVPPVSQQGGYEPPNQGGYVPPNTPSSQGQYTPPGQSYTPPPVDYSTQGTPPYSAAPAPNAARPWYKNPLVLILGTIGLCACLGLLCMFTSLGSALRELGGMEGLQATVEAGGGVPSGISTPVTGSGGTGNSNDPGREVSAFDLQVGQCFNDPDDTTSVNSVLVLDCATPHDNEIFHMVDYPAGSGDPFPGEDAIDAFAEGECSAAFQPYVGSDYSTSAYYVSYYQPSEGTWDNGDREIVCFLYEQNTQMEGSARGSGR